MRRHMYLFLSGESLKNQESKADAADGTNWELAKEFATQVGAIPGSFSSVVRALVLDSQKNDGGIQPVARASAERLFRIPACLAVLYFGVKDLVPEEALPVHARWSPAHMFDSFRALDLAAFLASFVYYKKCRALIGEELWEYLREPFRKESMIGAHVGIALPKIGMGAAMLVSSMRFFGLSAIGKTDPKLFRQYRREFKGKGQTFDGAYEKKLFGCSSAEIAVFLMSGIGFGTEICSGFRAAFDPISSLTQGNEDLGHRMQIADAWISALGKGRKQPEGAIPGHYFPLKEQLPLLLSKTEEILSSAPHWFDRTREEIGPDRTPELFRTASSSASARQPVVDIPESDLDDILT